MKNRLPEIVQEWLDKQDPKISITRLAQMAGVNPSTLTRMLNGDPQRIDLKVVEGLYSVIDFDLGKVIVEIEEFAE